MPPVVANHAPSASAAPEVSMESQRSAAAPYILYGQHQALTPPCQQHQMPQPPHC